MNIRFLFVVFSLICIVLVAVITIVVDAFLIVESENTTRRASTADHGTGTVSYQYHSTSTKTVLLILVNKIFVSFVRRSYRLCVLGALV